MQCEAMERRPGSRVLSVILVGTGICALALSMWMNARFGWAQADALEDRTVMAGLHTLADPAAAALGAAGGMFLAWGWRWHGFGAILFAFAFIAWSMVSVYGFMATRIAASEGHKNSIKVQERYLSWVQGQTVNFDLPKSERHAMKDEVKATVDKLTSAAKVIPDAQAASLAGMFGTSVERIQLKFACMFYGLFAWPYRRSSASSDTSSDSSAGSSSGNSSGNSRFSGERTSCEQAPKDNIIKLPPAVAANFTANIELPQVRQSNFEIRQVRKAEVRPHVVQPNLKSRYDQSEALSDLVRHIREKGPITSQRQLCDRWNRPKSVVSEWLSDWEADGYIVRRREGNQKSIALGRFDANKRAEPADPRTASSPSSPRS